MFCNLPFREIARDFRSVPTMKLLILKSSHYTVHHQEQHIAFSITSRMAGPIRSSILFHTAITPFFTLSRAPSSILSCNCILTVPMPSFRSMCWTCAHVTVAIPSFALSSCSCRRTRKVCCSRCSYCFHSSRPGETPLDFGRNEPALMSRARRRGWVVRWGRVRRMAAVSFQVCAQMSRVLASVAAGWRGCERFDLLISRLSSWWMSDGNERDIVERVSYGW